MPLTVHYDLKLQAFETPDASIDSPDPQINWHELEADIKLTLDAESSVPVSKAWADKRTLTAGADTIDLTSLTGPFASSIDLTGLRVNALRITADKSNSEDLVVKFGASNPYPIFGAAGTVNIPPGGALLMIFNAKMPLVSASVKDIDVSSADATAVYRVVLAAG